MKGNKKEKRETQRWKGKEKMKLRAKNENWEIKITLVEWNAYSTFFRNGAGMDSVMPLQPIKQTFGVANSDIGSPIKEIERMSVEVLDSATIVNFVEDEEAFNISIRERFAHLDTNHDGLLSYTELSKDLQSLRVLETHFGIDIKTDPKELAHVYESLFEQFDHDSNGTVDLEEFKLETKRMMLAMANGMGFLPVQMVLEEGSLLKIAVEHESTKLIAA
ncbi:hypothetical protein Goari_016654 [Gossypium aridum]|uniref:EF-hand domain-containing protein n=5 Tax=Gossypium TaxID=3633 RepID=A0A7J8WJG9_GOSAI|nr:hypothetical protein [Gossypium aridum]